ncbi:hypothetical protein BN8_00090 [Fibrisoma limi BUZ 3]|uniref:Outer membrane protein beta-barrel domain-containing protein n=1 Tax=Fibrisoma limi BUZ 3 TaxID=1185876 RepID=I2GBA2_9BACT|nr:hypothetical protein [Fibrisoma limi]CCH51176.1 hypothetical protein BN8_00090 [Fibrisoma limi BUZ 3]
MRKILVALLTTIALHSYAQSPVASRLRGGFDVGLAIKNDYYNPSITYYQLINLGDQRLFSLGWTGRLGAFYGDNLNYYTAPARLTRGQAGLGSLGKSLLVQNIDTVRFDYVTMTSFNLGLRAQFNFGPVEVGASADLLGITLLRRYRTGRYRSSTGAFTAVDSLNREVQKPFQGPDAFQRARAQRWNLRLLGDNDYGMLATEVYARVRINQRFAVKAGYQWLTTEMVVDNRDVVADNNRFRNRTGFPYIALTLPIFY